MVKLVGGVRHREQYVKKFKIGQRYSRDDIHRVVGGSKIEYLPTVGGEVVAGCFRRDTNPEAPDVVLPGNGPRIKRAAEAFALQSTPIPVFIKQRPKEWLYVGDYRVAQHGTSRSEIDVHSKRAGRQDITSVLHLQHVGEGC